MCKRQQLFVVVVVTSSRLWSPIPQHYRMTSHPITNHLWPMSLRRTFPLLFVLQRLCKFLLSNVYLNITNEPACQSPADWGKDMVTYQRRCTLCWDGSHSTALERNSGLETKRKWTALTHKHPLSRAVMDRQRAMQKLMNANSLVLCCPLI